MKGTLKLTNPIDINGRKVSELKYDTNEITAELFAQADANKATYSRSKNGNMAGAAELDYSLHLYLGFAGIMAVNPEIDVTDLNRIKGSDSVEVMKIGRDFISGRSEDDSEQPTSGEQSATMQEPFQPQQLTSEDDA